MKIAKTNYHRHIQYLPEHEHKFVEMEISLDRVGGVVLVFGGLRESEPSIVYI